MVRSSPACGGRGRLLLRARRVRARAFAPNPARSRLNARHRRHAGIPALARLMCSATSTAPSRRRHAVRVTCATSGPTRRRKFTTTAVRAMCATSERRPIQTSKRRWVSFRGSAPRATCARTAPAAGRRSAPFATRTTSVRQVRGWAGGHVIARCAHNAMT